jgi:hypothetical protein
VSRRRRRESAIVRAIREQGDRIIVAIREASAEQNEHREAMADRAGDFLRAALDEGTPRAVVLDPPTANDTNGDD